MSSYLLKRFKRKVGDTLQWTGDDEVFGTLVDIDHLHGSWYEVVFTRPDGETGRKTVSNENLDPKNRWFKKFGLRSV